MTQTEFIKKIIGKPWKNRSASFDAVDCFGLIILYYRHVLNIELPTVDGFASGGDFVDCYEKEKHKWKKAKAPSINGVVFTCYRGETPVHVGLLVGHGKVLHSRGSDMQTGKVEIHSLRAIKSIYGKMTFHEFVG